MLWAAVAVMALLLVADSAAACPACGNPSLPQLPTGSGTRDAGTGSVRASLNGSAMRVSHPAGCTDPADCYENPIQEEHSHELLAVPMELRLSAQWSIAHGLAVEGELPLRMVVMRADYETPDGHHYDPIDEGVHHRNETLFGFSDAQLRLAYTAVIERWWLTGRVGTSLPFGSTVEDPFELGDNGIEHQHVQFGSGTFNPSVGGDVTRGWPKVQLSVYGSAQFALYENRHGFRPGTRSLVGAATTWKASPWLSPYVILEGGFEGPERWGGEVEQDGLLGRRELRAGLGLRAIVRLRLSTSPFAPRSRASSSTRMRARAP